MFESLKEGYTFFARYDEDTLVATLTLKDNGIYKDVDKLEDAELSFLSRFKNIESLLDDKTGLSIIYDDEQNKFISSIKNKTFVGEYNDEIVWNNKISGEGTSFMDSLERLEEKLSNNYERRSVWWRI